MNRLKGRGLTSEQIERRLQCQFSDDRKILKVCERQRLDGWGKHFHYESTDDEYETEDRRTALEAQIREFLKE